MVSGIEAVEPRRRFAADQAKKRESTARLTRSTDILAALDRGLPACAGIALGRLRVEGLTCKVETGRALVEAGLHPATGGDGLSACSGDMLLEALVACAGVTLRAVATALDIELRDGTVSAEGDLDFRGTLGVRQRCAGRVP